MTRAPCQRLAQGILRFAHVSIMLDGIDCLVMVSAPVLLMERERPRPSAPCLPPATGAAF